MSFMIKFTILLSISLILITYFLNKRSYSTDKYTPIESGFEPIESKIGIDSKERYYIKFYIIGIIFLIFDLESILLYPFTTFILHNFFFISDNYILFYTVFLLFIFFILLGLAYEFFKGVL